MNWREFKSALSLKQKFNVDVAWNVGSLTILGAGGVVINTVIAAYVGAEALGAFNQVFAIYIMLSQISVGGIHFSVLKHVSHHHDDLESCRDIAGSGLMLGAMSGGVVSLAAYLLGDWAGSVLDSPAVAVGMKMAAPGLLFFSLNKILLNVLNGVRSMRAFAVFQALRFVFILISVVAIIFLGHPGERLALSLTLSEALLFLLLFAYVNAAIFPLRIGARSWKWVRAHVSFGVRGFMSGLLSEMNTRVDVLMLGYFSGDAIVGVYSYAAILAEGIAQLPIVLRRNVDPIVGRCFAADDRAGIEVIARKMKRVTYVVMATVAFLAVPLYPVVLKVFVPGVQFAASWAVFAILMAGILINSGYRPLLGILLQGGRPGMNTVLICSVVGSNVILNAALIPKFDMIGAAAATGLAFVLEAVFLVTFARKCLAVKI